MNPVSILAHISSIGSQISAQIGMPALIVLGVVLLVLLIAMSLGYRLLITGMKLGREQRVGNWYLWKK
jgi:hypothetical protein